MIGDRDMWGTGVIQETRAAILKFCFDTLGLEKVNGGCYANNAPAVYNYRRQGWAVDGSRKQHAIYDGKRTDLVHFAMFHEDWRAADGLDGHMTGREILASAFELSLEEVPEDASLEKFPTWDSLRHVRVLMELEAVLGRPLDTEESISVVDVDSVELLLQTTSVRE